jgi:hypothetical protein
MIWGSHRHRVGPACDAEVIGRLFAGFRSKEWEYRVYSRAGADMITGVHAVIFTADAERDRAFFRNVLEFPSVDAGGGWLIFALRPRSWRPVLPKRAASTSSGRRTKRDGMYTRRGRITGDPDPRASRAPTCFLPDGLEAIPPEPEALATLDRAANGLERGADHRYWRARAAGADLWQLTVPPNRRNPGVT